MPAKYTPKCENYAFSKPHPHFATLAEKWEADPRPPCTSVSFWKALFSPYSTYKDEHPHEDAFLK